MILVFVKKICILSKSIVLANLGTVSSLRGKSTGDKRQQKTPFREKNWWMEEMKQEYVYVVKHMNILHIHNSYE